jgi:hypothetical protein
MMSQVNSLPRHGCEGRAGTNIIGKG